MTNETANGKSFAPSRLLIRALDCSQRGDYLVAFAIGAWPILLSWLIGAHRTVGRHIGYWDSHWWTLAIVLPALLWAFRLLMSRIVPVGPQWPPPRHPPVVELVRGEDAQRAVYEGLREKVLARINLAVPLAATFAIHLLDAPLILEPYFGTKSSWPSWASMFEVVDTLDKGENLLLVFSAGLVQFCIVLLGLLAITLIFRHNLFFLRNVYQRRWVPAGEEARFFQVNPKDVDRCFGFRAAHVAFNSQVRALMIAGVAILVSRYGVLITSASAQPEFLTFRPDAPDFGELFPLPSQWIMALAWLVALAVVAMPALVKLLPRLGGDADRGERSIANFLREYFSDRSWPRDKTGANEPLPQVAARFARNSFWPTGDNRAGVLFFFAYWIFLVTLVPVPANNLSLVLLIIAGSAVLAYVAQQLTFKALRLSLHYVDEMLINPPAGAEAPLVNDTGDGGEPREAAIFISYRRRDSAPYARALHERLSQAFGDDHVFVDIRDIAPGENFVDRIDRTLAAVDTVLVLIGDRWLTLTGDDGRPRLQDPDDVVRLEITTALRQDKRLIPVLVGGAQMPAADQLPVPLKPLAMRNAVELSETRWDFDLGQLIGALRRR